MSYTSTIDQEILEQWLLAKRDPHVVQEELIARGLNAKEVTAHVKAFRKLLYAKKQTTGFIYMAAGAFMGFISCVLSMINPVPELYGVILYGLTSVAILLIMAGLYFVFE